MTLSIYSLNATMGQDLMCSGLPGNATYSNLTDNNFTQMDANNSYSNETGSCLSPAMSSGITPVAIMIVSLYGLICLMGLLGNGLVILVISRYTKMKTVTNLYILNLSIADFLFLLGLPLIMTTALLRQWVFGEALCKIYLSLTCVNMFTGTFTLTLMSADRFMAVVHPISSLRWRTPRYALMALGGLWLLSIMVLQPVLLFARLTYTEGYGYSCDMVWPAGQALAGHDAFFIYTLLLGFVIPVTLIVVLYSMLLVRLRQTTTKFRSADKRRSHRKVTRLVSMVIIVFIVCWLPHWAIQTHLIIRAHSNEPSPMASWTIFLIQSFTLLSYANSMINPLLYAFTNESFREAFISAFFCVADPILGNRRQSDTYSTVANNNQVATHQPRIKPQTEQSEMTALNSKPNSEEDIKAIQQAVDV